MNKLKEAKEKAFIESSDEPTWDEGWNAHAALDLPVKFADWKYISTTMIGNDFYSAGEYLCTFNGTMDALYKYWIDNIYKPE
jgi:hypothetical protein